ncbi:MAG TPA: helix-turn-helix transcriptional regulator [Xanthobacteraceae bacterium]|nr:helix-turn-helix transcriptional regulator [Xanthobacteraceae bacterium]
MSEKPAPRARRIIDAGKTLAGARWQSALSRASGISQSYLAMIASGERPMTDEVEDKVVAALGKEIARLGKTAERLAEIQGRILAARETGR